LLIENRLLVFGLSSTLTCRVIATSICHYTFKITPKKKTLNCDVHCASLIIMHLSSHQHLSLPFSFFMRTFHCFQLPMDWDCRISYLCQYGLPINSNIYQGQFGVSALITVGICE
jgi:hypothetical protein